MQLPITSFLLWVKDHRIMTTSHLALSCREFSKAIPHPVTLTRDVSFKNIEFFSMLRISLLQTFTGICQNGDLELLELLYEKIPDQFNEGVYLIAAKYGRLDMLKWLRERKVPWDPSAMDAAAEYGHLSILRWCRKNQFKFNPASLTSHAAKGGHLNVLDFLYHFIPTFFNGSTFRGSASTFIGAIQAGHVHVVKWLLNKRLKLHSYLCGKAAEVGNLEILKLLVQHGCPLDEIVVHTAAAYDRAEILKYAIENGCPWYRKTLNAVLDNRNLDLFKWCWQNGCPRFHFSINANTPPEFAQWVRDNSD